jgi:hypothetical protein
LALPAWKATAVVEHARQAPHLACAPHSPSIHAAPPAYKAEPNPLSFSLFPAALEARHRRPVAAAPVAQSTSPTTPKAPPCFIAPIGTLTPSLWPCFA